MVAATGPEEDIQTAHLRRQKKTLCLPQRQLYFVCRNVSFAGRRHRRGKKRGMPCFSDDDWRVILHWLQPRPSRVLMLSWTCKSMRRIAVADDQYWLQVLQKDQEQYFNVTERHGRVRVNVSRRVQGIFCQPVPNFVPTQQRVEPPWRSFDLKRRWPDAPLSDERVRALAVYCRRIVALRIGCRCCLCGARWRHVPVWTLRGRVCYDCLRSNLVSNVVLFRRYGVPRWTSGSTWMRSRAACCTLSAATSAR